MLDWLATVRLRPVLTLLGLSGFLALAACGGGSGAPNNPYAPGTTTPVLTVAPTALTAYSGIPVTVTITGGVAPFFAFTSNASVLPVAQNVADNTIVLLPNKVVEDTDVTLTVQDTAGQTKTVAVTVKAAPIFNALTFAPSGGDCGSDLCSGQTGSATVVATGPGGAPLVARQIRFDVIYGPIGFATSNPAAPLAQTLTVATDLAGTATVVVQALTNATTQPAQIRATDITSGQQQVANFTVVNNTVGTGSPIVVIPGTATITGPTSTTCSSGFRVNYYLYGGNPPYTVASTFPTAITLTGSPVSASGGFFTATTNGACVNPLTFTIVDSAGKQITAQLINDIGTITPPAPTAMVLAPPTVTELAVNGCSGKTYTFLLSGGAPPYNVQTPVTSPQTAGVPPAPSITNPIVSAAGGSFAINFPVGVYTGTVTSFLILDASTPSQSITGRITCS